MKRRTRFVAVILAGGSGERFWPLSRRARPKQFLALDGTGESLIQTTFARIKVLEPEEIFVVTNRAHCGLVLEHLPELPFENLIVEPVGRNTGPAIGLAILVIRERFGDEVTVGVFHSDHWIGDREAFGRVLEESISTAERHRESLVLLGIQPTYPATGYGYIELSDRIGQSDVHRVSRFVEKPDAQRAATFLERGTFVWNAGIFVFFMPAMLEAFRTHEPALIEALEGMVNGPKGAFAAQFAALEKIAIDTAIFERASNVLALRADFGWDDLGDWNALERLLNSGSPKLAIGQHVALDSASASLYTSTGSDLIVTIGLENVVVVRDGEVTLVVRKDKTQEVKRVVEILRQSPELERYL